MSQIDPNQLTKLYYTIGEVADMFGVSKSLIRFWETEFVYLKPNKNSKGERRFTRQNIEQLNTIYHLVKEKGYTLDGAKKEIRDNRQKWQQREQFLQSLMNIKSGLQNLQVNLHLKEEEE
jgi:DNA-binding transcriptional MerR regulator